MVKDTDGRRPLSFDENARVSYNPRWALAHLPPREPMEGVEEHAGSQSEANRQHTT